MKIATIREIAGQAGVSAATVSRVLNHDETIRVSLETRRKIFEVAEALSYQKPLRITKKETKVITFLLVNWYSEMEELNDPYFLSIRVGIENECLNQNIALHKAYNDPNHQGIYVLSQDRYDGIIVLGKFEPSQYEYFKKYTDYMVLVHGISPGFEYDAVSADFSQITKEVLDCILKKGHQKIGYIGGREKIIGSTQLYEDEREKVFRDDLKNLCLLNDDFIKIGTFDFQSGYVLMKELMAAPGGLPTCIFTASDTLAIGALRALNEQNIAIPQEVALISCNDIPTSQYTSPTLSTVKIYTELMGSQSVQMLLEQKNGTRTQNLRVIVPHEIKLRESF